MAPPAPPTEETGSLSGQPQVVIFKNIFHEYLLCFSMFAGIHSISHITVRKQKRVHASVLQAPRLLLVVILILMLVTSLIVIVSYCVYLVHVCFHTNRTFEEHLCNLFNELSFSLLLSFASFDWPPQLFCERANVWTGKRLKAKLENLC